MVTNMIAYMMTFAVLLVAGCGNEGGETARAKVGADVKANETVRVSLGLEDGPEELALVSQAFSGYVLNLTGGDDCWGPQALTFDSASGASLAVRKGAANCGATILKLRFREANAEILATATVASGLAVAAGQKGEFLVAGSARGFEVTVKSALSTSADSVILLAGRELKVDTAARHVIKSCLTPWGVEIADGASVTGFAQATVPYGSQCASNTLQCSDGVLSNASFKYASCTEPTLVSVALTSDKTEVLVGETAQLTVKAKFSDGSLVTVTAQSFTAQPANLVQITSAGVLKGLSDGTFSVTAKFDDMTSNAVAMSAYKVITQNVTLNENTFNSKLGLAGYYGGGYSLDDDSTTAHQACLKMGYLSGSIISTNHYVPTYNETLWFWNGSGFSYKKSKSSDRDHIELLNCVQQCKVTGATKVCSPN